MLCRSLREAAAICMVKKFFVVNKPKLDEALLVAITVFDCTSYIRKACLLAERDCDGVRMSETGKFVRVRLLSGTMMRGRRRDVRVRKMAVEHKNGWMCKLPRVLCFESVIMA